MVQENHVTRLFPPDDAVEPFHVFQNVAVADFGGMVAEAVFFAGHGQAEVAHDGGDQQVVFQFAFPLQDIGADDHDLVARDFPALLIHGNETVAVSVKGQAQGRAVLDHFFPEDFRMLRAAAVIDVGSVGRLVNDFDVGAQFMEGVGGDLVRGAVGGVQNDLHAFHGKIAGEGVFGEDNVASVHAVQTIRLPDVRSPGGQVGKFVVEDQVFDKVFLLVGKLVAVAAENFQTVVLERIVRSRDHDARVGAHALGDEGDRRRRHHADQIGIAPHGCDAGFQGALHHVAGKPGVLPDNDDGPVSFLFKQMRHGPPNAEGDFRGHGVLIGFSSNSVGSEQLAHRWSPLFSMMQRI